MLGFFVDLENALESGLCQVLKWLYAQTGSAGIMVLYLSIVVLLFYLVSWQTKNHGIKKVAKVYGLVLVISFLFFLFPSSGSSNSKLNIASSSDSKLQDLDSRLSNTVLHSAQLVRQQEQVVEYEDNKPLVYNRAIYLFWIVGLLGIIIFFLRIQPEWLKWRNITLLFNSSKNWIRPTRSKTNELGSCDLASLAQLKRWMKPSGKRYDTHLLVSDLRGNTGILVTNGELVIPVGERNRHILIIAKTGGGKTTKLILPILYNDCLCPERSTIVIDSKAEMWPKLSGMTRKYNPQKRLLLFNPLDRARSLSWNIVAKVQSDTDCKLIANSIILATDEPAAKQDSPFFRNSALQLLNAMMVGLLDDPNDVLSMPRIHELFNQGMLNLCDWLEAHPKAIRTTRAFTELARSGSQNADTIMSELSMRLQAWDLFAIRSTTSIDEIDIETVIKEPTLFVVELRESELKMLRPLANVIVVELLRYLTKYAEECPGQALPRPVGLVVDEFASSLGRLPDIHIKLNTLRSRNVSIVAAIQSIGQIKGNYGEDWESVISGFSTKIFMPSLDYMDSEWASKESGVMTVKFRTNSRGMNRKITENFVNRNVNSNEMIQQRQVLTPGEVGRPVDSQATFFLPETPVFQGHLVPYYKVPEMTHRLSEFNDSDKEVKLRAEPIAFEEKIPEPVIKKEGKDGEPGYQQPFTDEQVWAALEEVKVKQLDWENTVGDARQWWLAFEEENKTRIALVLKVAQEIVKRGATITDFFLAYVYSNTDNIQATLAYLDYTMHMKNSKQASETATNSEQAAAA